jgi:hypothetical protein
MGIVRNLCLAAMITATGCAASPAPQKPAAPQHDTSSAAKPQLSAAAQQPKPAAQRQAASASKPRLSDAAIEAAIKAKLAKSKIGADGFKVRVQGGVATWEGRTDVVQHKGAATRMAKTAGAIAVNNHIVVSEAARAKAQGNLEAGRRRAQIKRGDARTEASDKR